MGVTRHGGVTPHGRRSGSEYSCKYGNHARSGASGCLGGGTGRSQEVILMLQSIKKLIGDRLEASDGEIGHVKDFYFDDQNWVIRYVIVDTGTWVPGRQVLLSPHAFGNFYQGGKLLPANLSRRQIENSPSIELHKPVSRQYEEDYYRYYGWPSYWQGGGLWGLGGLPAFEMMVTPLPGKPDTAGGPQPKQNDTHLRSIQAVNGYQLQASDGKIGSICDFMMDSQSWAIHHLVIKTGHWPASSVVEIPTRKVDRISYEESTVFVNLNRETVEQSPSHHLV